MNKPITIAIIGLGSRGLDTYAACLERYPEKAKIVAVADVNPERVQLAAQRYQIPAERCFDSSMELLSVDRLADAIVLATPDACHHQEAIAALNKGYHLLLEKPVARTATECADIARLAERKGLHVAVCHVLRYTVFYQQLKALVDSGRIGDVVSIQAIERVGYWHQAHSFVRGNWHNKAKSTPMILQKCCHDLDILLWLAGRRCERVSSFGSLTHFRPENKPEGAPRRCVDGCPVGDKCLYNAERFYLKRLRKDGDSWPVNVLCSQPTEEKVRAALKNTDYGLCVYQCDNDVVDHQVVNMLLEGGATVQLTMCAFTSSVARSIRLMGTLGEVEGDMERNVIRVRPFGGEAEEIDVSSLMDDFSGHSGGDVRLVKDFLDLLTGEGQGMLTAIDQSVESHFAALAAEESRLENGRSIALKEFINKG